LRREVVFSTDVRDQQGQEQATMTTIGEVQARGGRPSRAAAVSPLGELGWWCFQHRRLVAAGWVLVLVVMTVAGRMAGSAFKTDLTGGNTQSQQAAAFLRQHFPAQAGDIAQVVFATRAPVTSAADRARINQTLAGLAGLPHVEFVRGPFGSGAAHQMSPDGHLAYGVVQFDRSGDALPDAAVQQVIGRALGAAGPGFEVQLGGAPVQKTENPAFGKSEAAGILAAVVILLLAFGSVIAMALPIVIAIAAVATTFGVLDVLSHVVTVPSFGPELAALVGLGVGIDYALFVVTRYRAALHAGADPRQAVETAMAVSGRAVVFAGSTVVLSLLGLFLLGLPFIYGAALGAIIAVAVVMAASVTLLPAGLGFAGASIDRLSVRRRHPSSPASGPAHGWWWRWSRQVQRRPWLAGATALAALALLAVPFTSLRLAFTDAGTSPASYTSRQAYDLLTRGFGPGANGPLVVALNLSGPAGQPAVASLRGDLARQPDVLSVTPPHYNPAKTAAVLTVIPRTSPQDARTAALVQRLRRSAVPHAVAGTGISALIGGETAASIDTSGVISAHLAVVVGFVIALSVLLLAAAFRSVIVPLVSAGLTLVSTAAAYGVMVAVFQWGWLGSGIDNGATAPVDPWIPLMLFALLFGFSMDYQVFLLSRIREEWLGGATDSDAVANGLAATGRVITSAAAIMICVFAAFVLGDLRVLRVIGLGMAVAIFLDATLVRMIAMPAALRLLGRASWWFPRWLDRVTPAFLAEATPEAMATPQATAAPIPAVSAPGAVHGTASIRESLR
jgi:RND superfamily putative drug exporter